MARFTNHYRMGGRGGEGGEGREGKGRIGGRRGEGGEGKGEGVSMFCYTTTAKWGHAFTVMRGLYSPAPRGKCV